LNFYSIEHTPSTGQGLRHEEGWLVVPTPRGIN